MAAKADDLSTAVKTLKSAIRPKRPSGIKSKNHRFQVETGQNRLLQFG